MAATDTKQIPKDLEVQISSPTGVHMEEVAQSVSAVNGTGPFDILPGHRNFITMLLPCTIIVQTTSGKTKELEVTSGVMHVKDNRVEVFLHFL